MTVKRECENDVLILSINALGGESLELEVTLVQGAVADFVVTDEHGQRVLSDDDGPGPVYKKSWPAVPVPGRHRLNFAPAFIAAVKYRYRVTKVTNAGLSVDFKDCTYERENQGDTFFDSFEVKVS